MKIEGNYLHSHSPDKRPIALVESPCHTKQDPILAVNQEKAGTSLQPLSYKQIQWQEAELTERRLRQEKLVNLQKLAFSFNPDQTSSGTTARQQLRSLISLQPDARYTQLLNDALQVGEGNPRAAKLHQIITSAYLPATGSEAEPFNAESVEYALNSLSIGAQSDNAWGRELAKKHWDAIGATKENFLDIFLNAFEKISSFQRDFGDFMSLLAGFIGSSGDKGDVTFNVAAFTQELDKLVDKYSGDAGQLFPEADEDVSKEDCENWIKQMGLPPGSLKEVDGVFTVVIDLSALTTMKNNPPASVMSAARYSAWEASFNAHKDTMQNNAQMFVQKLTNANSLYDNLIKVFSNYIEQDLNCAKSFLNF